MKSPGSACCLMLFGLPFLLGGLGILGMSGLALLTSRQAKAWPEVPAYVDSVEVKTSRTSKGGTTRSLSVRYRYKVDGREYVGERAGPDPANEAYLPHEAELAAHRDSGQPLLARVNPADPTEAVLFTELSFTGAYALPVAGIIFGGAGLAIILGALASHGASLGRARREAEHPDRPWRHDAAWDDFRVQADGGTGSLVALWLATAFIGLFMSMFVVLMVEDPSAPLAVRGMVVCFALIPVGLLAAAVYVTVRHLKYGRPVLHVKALPVLPGATLEGAIEVRAPIDAREGVKLTLKCLRSTTTGSGKNSHTTTDTLHEESLLVGEGDVRAAYGGATLIPVKVLVPAGLPARDPPGTNPGHAWKLEAHGETPGVDFAATFDLPVFSADEALVERRQDPLPS